MSKISVDTITDEAGTGAPDFPNGISATGPFTSLGIDDNATSTAITVDSAGRLGVGTASPTEKLDVAGTVKATSFSGDGSTLTGIESPVKAWVSFNGKSVVSIRASLNVSSITDNGQGNYTVNFSTAMADTDYVVLGNVQSNTPVITVNTKSTVRTVNAIAVGVGYTNTGTGGFINADTDYVSVTVIR